MKEIEIIHPNGERRSLAIEVIDRKFVSVYWPLSGTYNIILKTGEMKANSVSARRKNSFCLWKAVDIVAIRAMVYEYFNPKVKEEAQKRFDYHTQTMPHRAKPISSSSK